MIPILRDIIWNWTIHPRFYLAERTRALDLFNYSGTSLSVYLITLNFI